MKQSWAKTELEAHWLLLPDEYRLLHEKMEKHRLAFAIMLKYLQYTGRFPEKFTEVPSTVINFLAEQLNLNVDVINHYELEERIVRDHKSIIRQFLGLNTVTSNDIEQIEEWLLDHVLSQENSIPAIESFVYNRLNEMRLVPLTKSQIEQCIQSALSQFEQRFFSDIASKLSDSTKQSIDELINTPKNPQGPDLKYTKIPLSYLKHDPRQASVKTVLKEIIKLQRIQYLGLPKDIFQNISSKVLQKYRLRVTMETPSQLYDHPIDNRNAMISAFCYLRGQTITDNLIDIVIQITNKIATKAEKRVIKELLKDLKKITGKTGLLYRIAEASVKHPKGIINEVIYPVAGEQTLKDLVKEFKSTGLAYKREIHSNMRSSYGNHYRRMLTPILNTLQFRTNNENKHAIIDAIRLLKKYADSKLVYYPNKETVPIDGIVHENTYDIVVEETEDGT